MEGLRIAAVAWAAGGADADAAAKVVRESAGRITCAVLVEGPSDLAAVEALASARGRSLPDEGVVIVPLGGATSVGRFVGLLVPLGVPVRGLCDAGEEWFFRRALTRAGLGPVESREQLEALGFFVCEVDLEDELIRALGVEVVERVIADRGDLDSLRTFENQPAQRERPVDRRLRRFMGTTSGRKIAYAKALVEALDPSDVPRPLDRLLAGL